MDAKAIGKKLREHRAKHGWTREVCAERIGISPRYLADIERGHKTPQLETFVRILNVLAASSDDVLQDELTVDCSPKSNQLLDRMHNLTPTQKIQVLDILESTITTMEKNG